MNTRSQLICVRCCYVFLALFIAGFTVLAGFVPPPDPTASAQQIAAMFSENTTGIRLGMCLCIFASALLLPWGGAVIVQLKRIEGRHSPLTYAWIAAHGCLVLEFIYPCMFWAVAAFRAEDDATRIQQFNDLAWLPFLGITSTAVFQAFALGILTLKDNRANPVFPRWFGYFQIWDAILFAPAGLIMFFKTGPLAWNGIIAFWIAITAAVAWFVVTTAATSRAIKRQDSEPDDRDRDSDLAPRVARLEDQLAQLTDTARARRLS